jgi:HK97 gp10 family phage protein
MADVKITWDTETLLRELEITERKAVTALASRYERILQELFRLPKRGRLYGINRKKLKALRKFRAGKRKRAPNVHRASAPGQAPAIDTGALRKGITREIGKDASGTYVEIGVSNESGRAEIAAHLEMGTVKMAPRPSWRPALDQLRKYADEDIAAAAKKG